ncbi:hypothetical protein BV898_17144 [Hypsibius exemplaris]|uniref:G-protein coupled receptors family 1 profile domain-containing protein n=1 Tax=Hypsibius exemplaris TaxID=2072580 RepID=A0A9X6RLR4_HYPEX|nr:hypothetical protein BV898_17144 [Hypsibius exemplaris]
MFSHDSNNNSNSNNLIPPNYFSVPEADLPDDIKYGLTNTVVIVMYSFLLLASLLVNTLFLGILIRRRHRTRTHYLMINLCLSNLYLVLLEMPLQIGWNATVYWAGTDGLCRALSYFSIIGLYGNAFFTVAIAVDRWQSISRAVGKTTAGGGGGGGGGGAATFAQKIGKQRTSLTIVSAWTAAHVCSIPQAIIYHVEEHPGFRSFYQCVTFHYWRSQVEEIAYNICVSMLIYVVPLLALTGCSMAIWLYIRDHAYPYVKQASGVNDEKKHNRGPQQHAKVNENAHRPSSVSLSCASRLQDRSMRFRCSTKRLLCRAERQAFRLTVVFLTIFIACHTPYQIISIWRVVNPALGDMLNPIVHRLLFACGVLPTIVDPIAYAKFLIPITNELKVIMSRRRRSSVSRKVRNAMAANGGEAYSTESPVVDVELTRIIVSVVEEQKERNKRNQRPPDIPFNYSPPGVHFSVSSSRSLLNVRRSLSPER